MLKYLSFHNSSKFALRYFFNANGKATLCHAPRFYHGINVGAGSTKASFDY
jgi:hypothetical protein